MSKPYRIQVQESIAAADCSTFQVDAPPLATPQEFSEILEDVMIEAGWERDKDGRLGLDLAEGERYVFHPETMQIKTNLHASEDVTEELEGWTPQSVHEKADQLVAQREQQLEARLTQQLEEHQEERKEVLEQLVVDATGRALKDIAQRLGDVQDIHEERSEDGTYRLTISIQERD